MPLKKQRRMLLLFCRLEDSPPAGRSVAPEQPMQSKTDAPQSSGKVMFGVQAKPLKVVHKKKIILPEKALESIGNGQHANGASHPPPDVSKENGNALLGLGSYGSESD